MQEDAQEQRAGTLRAMLSPGTQLLRLQIYGPMPRGLAKQGTTCFSEGCPVPDAHTSSDFPVGWTPSLYNSKSSMSVFKNKRLKSWLRPPEPETTTRWSSGPRGHGRGSATAACRAPTATSRHSGAKRGCRPEPSGPRPSERSAPRLPEPWRRSPAQGRGRGRRSLCFQPRVQASGFLLTSRR